MVHKWFVLRFYSPVNPLGSCQAWSVNLITLFPEQGWSSKRLPSICAHAFARNWQLPFLNQRKGKNDHRKYFMIKRHERMMPFCWGSNMWPPDLQSDAHLTEPTRPTWSIHDLVYSQTSMARTALGPWKFVRDNGSSSHWGLIIAQGQKANKNNPGMSFP